MTLDGFWTKFASAAVSLEEKWLRALFETLPNAKPESVNKVPRRILRAPKNVKQLVYGPYLRPLLFRRKENGFKRENRKR